MLSANLYFVDRDHRSPTLAEKSTQLLRTCDSQVQTPKATRRSAVDARPITPEPIRLTPLEQSNFITNEVARRFETGQVKPVLPPADTLDEIRHRSRCAQNGQLLDFTYIW